MGPGAALHAPRGLDYRTRPLFAQSREILALGSRSTALGDCPVEDAVRPVVIHRHTHLQRVDVNLGVLAWVC